jgi:hypothetical protein
MMVYKCLLSIIFRFYPVRTQAVVFYLFLLEEVTFMDSLSGEVRFYPLPGIDSSRTPAIDPAVLGAGLKIIGS